MSRWAANHVEEIDEALCHILEKRGMVPEGEDPYEVAEKLPQKLHDELWMEAFQDAWDKAYPERDE